MDNPFDQFDVPATDPVSTALASSTTAPKPADSPAAHDPQAANPFDQFDPAPVTEPGTTMGFADEAPTEASRQLSPEDTTEFYRMFRGEGRPRATAKELRDFVAGKGLALSNAEKIVADRDAGHGVVGEINYPLPKPVDPSTKTGATLRGASQGATLGTGDELHGLFEGAKAALAGRDFSDVYENTVDADRGRLAADEEQHPYAAIAGNLVGGLALPLGLEKAGITASMDAVGVAAYRAARAEGLAAEDARIVAQRAIARRLAAEGAAYGGAYGAGSADGGPGQRLVGGATGAVEGGAGGAALGLIGEKIAPRLYDARVASRALPAEPLPEGAQVAQAADRQGIAILPQDIGGPSLARSTQAIAQTPFGAKKIGEAANRLYESFSGRVGELAGDAPAPIDAGNIVGGRAADTASRSVGAADRTSGAVQDALAAPQDATGAGQLIQRGVSHFIDDTADRASALYNEVPIASDRPAQLSNTRRLLNDLTADWQSNPELGSIFRNGRLSNFLDALTPNVEKTDTGLLDATGKPVTRDVTQGGNLSWQDLSEFRTRVGDMLADPNLTEKIAPRQLRSLYGALSTDMEATAKDAGPDAFSKWKRANNFYDGRMKRINDTFLLVLGKKNDATPNEAFSAVQAMLKPGSTGNTAAFARIMRSLPPEDANVVRASIVNDARGGAQFDPDKFSSAWGSLSERAKSALLPQPGMRNLMDDAAGRAALSSRNPFAGLSGEQIYSKLETMAGTKGDAARFQATMAGLSPDEAQAVRSTFIDRLGRATPGAQNAEGDAFSVARWLIRWNTMTPQARTVLFGRGELRAAMDDLATVAARVKGSERLAGHSNTGSVLEFNKTNLSLWGSVQSLITGAFTGHTGAGVVAAASLAAPAAYQRISAQILTSPRLLRWLARVPKEASFDGQLNYLAKLSTIAAREPAIAPNVIELRSFLRDAMTRSPAQAAARNDVSDRRHVPPEQQRQSSAVR